MIPGLTFAQSGGFFNDEGGKIEYIAEEPVTVLRIQKEQFLKDLSQNHTLCHEYLNMNLKNQIFLINRIIYQAEKGINAKLAHWIVFMNKFYGKQITSTKQEITIPVTQSTIANFLHATRESINPALLYLIKKKYIQIINKKIIINELDKLKQLYKH